ncbi:MAG: PadR family transcriptional regulator [Ignisphaera sp.]
MLSVMVQSKALKRLIRKVTIETLWLYIARILHDSEPMKAYDVKKKLQEVFNINPPTITVYTVVYRMNKEGLLDTIRIGGEVLYKLSDRGRKEFYEALEFLEKLVDKLKI